MVGSSGDVNQGTTAGDNDRACRGQSIRGSEEASNDRGAKGCRKAVSGGERRPSHEGRRSAARLSASVRWRTAWPRSFCWQWAARNWVSGSARTTRLACSLRTSRNTSLSQPIGSCRLESRMRYVAKVHMWRRGSQTLHSLGFEHLRRHIIFYAYSLVTSLPFLRLGWYVQQTVPPSSGDFAACQRSVGS